MNQTPANYLHSARKPHWEPGSLLIIMSLFRATWSIKGIWCPIILCQNSWEPLLKVLIWYICQPAYDNVWIIVIFLFPRLVQSFVHPLHPAAPHILLPAADLLPCYSHGYALLGVVLDWPKGCPRQGTARYAVLLKSTIILPYFYFN